MWRHAQRKSILSWSRPNETKAVSECNGPWPCVCVHTHAQDTGRSKFAQIWSKATTFRLPQNCGRVPTLGQRLISYSKDNTTTANCLRSVGSCRNKTFLVFTDSPGKTWGRSPFMLSRAIFKNECTPLVPIPKCCIPLEGADIYTQSRSRTFCCICMPIFESCVSTMGKKGGLSRVINCADNE